MSTPGVEDSVEQAASVAAQAATVAVAEKNPADAAASSSEVTGGSTAEAIGSSSDPAKSSSEGSGSDKQNGSSSSSSSSSDKMNNEVSGDVNENSAGMKKGVISNTNTHNNSDSDANKGREVEESFIVRLIGGQEIRINRKEVLEANLKFMQECAMEKKEEEKKIQSEVERLGQVLIDVKRRVSVQEDHVTNREQYVAEAEERLREEREGLEAAQRTLNSWREQEKNGLAENSAAQDKLAAAKHEVQQANEQARAVEEAITLPSVLSSKEQNSEQTSSLKQKPNSNINNDPSGDNVVDNSGVSGVAQSTSGGVDSGEGRTESKREEMQSSTVGEKKIAGKRKRDGDDATTNDAGKDDGEPPRKEAKFAEIISRLWR
jgi:hypothetical protein